MDVVSLITFRNRTSLRCQPIRSLCLLNFLYCVIGTTMVYQAAVKRLQYRLQVV